MKWIDKLERRFGHIAIHDLMMIIVIGQAVVFLAEFLCRASASGASFRFICRPCFRAKCGACLRSFCALFFPPLSLVLTLYLMWLIGHTLEQSWGDFRFNVYYFLGVLGAILAAAVTAGAQLII